jgi:hypothetical protein
MKDLVQIIRDNPNAVAVIDNDCWWIYRESPENNPHEDYDKQDEWDQANILVSSDDRIGRLGDGGYGSGNCYGGDILQALAVIVGLKVESV